MIMKFSHRLTILIVGAFLALVFLLLYILNEGYGSSSHMEKMTNFLEDNPVLFEIQDNQSDQSQCRADFTGQRDVLSTLDLAEQTNFQTRPDGQYDLPHAPKKDAAYGDNLEPLTVIVVPHSHVDPGWLWTLDEYYIQRVKPILDNMVIKLQQYSDLTFIWAEIVFLSKWWSEQNPSVQDQVRSLVKEGRLEIVLGGWVMPDEASTHYISVIDQLVEGHQWVIENLQVRPVNSWSIDPFGHSGTMPYLWRRSGMTKMVIQRIHQATKSSLIQKRSLEFYWKQFWDREDSTDNLCHVMPYTLYSLHHTCGPDKFVCALYDFKQLNGDPVYKVIQPITDGNVVTRAQSLYEQYRLKASLYNYNTILVPLGDDFRFYSGQEWDQQYVNYTKLMSYMNGRKDWRITVKFGTVKDYFSNIRRVKAKKSVELPSLSGDFFPYSDNDNMYWTGYYTTRPFDKRFSREVESRLRAAEILNVLALGFSRQWNVQYSHLSKIARKLQEARQNLGLFLHHDAITGTAKSYVVADYENKLYTSFTNAAMVAEIAAQFLLTQGKLDGDQILQPELFRDDPRVASMHQMIIPTKDGARVVIFNPTGQIRKEFTEIVVSTTEFEIIDSNRKSVPYQINPIFSSAVEVNAETFEVVFLTKIPAFSIETYIFRKIETQPKHFWSKLSIFNSDQLIVRPELKFEQERPRQRGNIFVPIIIENEQIRAEFRSFNGMLTKITDKKTEKSTKTIIEFKAYISRGSGAYIFFPNGPAKDMLQGVPVIRVIEGPFVTEVQAVYPSLFHRVKLYHHPGVQGRNLHIQNALDLHVVNMKDREPVMRITTDLENSLGSFFTDENGYQMIGRKKHPGNAGRAHIERNYYPITTMAFIEDGNKRVTLHTGQPHGAASLEKGQFEVMIDRQLLYDDERGLGEGVVDNKLTMTKFVLQVERSDLPLREEKYTYPSLQSILVNEFLQQPLYKMFTPINSDILSLKFTVMHSPLPCDITVVSLKTLCKSNLKYNGTSLILHRKGYRCGFPDDKLECSAASLSLAELFPGVKDTQVRETSLTHLVKKKASVHLSDLQVSPMEIKSYVVDMMVED